MKRKVREVTCSLSLEDQDRRILECIQFLALRAAQTYAFTFVWHLSSKEVTSLAEWQKVTWNLSYVETQ